MLLLAVVQGMKHAGLLACSYVDGVMPNTPPPPPQPHPTHPPPPLPTGAESECYGIFTTAFADAACTDGCCTAEGLLPNGTSTFCGFNEDIDSVIVSGTKGQKEEGRGRGRGGDRRGVAKGYMGQDKDIDSVIVSGTEGGGAAGVWG